MADPERPAPHPPTPVDLVTAEVVRPLRHAVLRPGWPDEESIYPGDDLPGTVHAAIRDGANGQVVAVGTVLVELAPWAPDDSAWRVRGMATDEHRRGEGLGAFVLGALLAHAAQNGGGLLWCNARITAISLYERAGLVGRGELFDLPGIGVHRQMWRSIQV